MEVVSTPRMHPEDISALRSAVETLEHPSLIGRLSALAGRPIELARQALPAQASDAVLSASAKALHAALALTLRTMHALPGHASPMLHKSLAAVSGAVGGGFGIVALPIELPISTVIMLRSIVQIARSHGETIDNAETALSCLQVFALGAGTGERDLLGNGYFAVRATLANTLSQAAQFIAERGIAAEGAPVLVRFVSQVASRFGLVVTQKLAAQTLPLIGALGGAAVNYAFISHFQHLAQAHFTVRRLERVYGNEPVRREYEEIRGSLAGASRFAA